MSREEVFDKVQEIFRDIFDDENLVIQDSTNANDIDEWDSLTHISLVSAIEKEFGIKFALGELNSLKNIGAMIDIIVDKIK